MKLKSYYEAIEAYTQATADSAYDAVGTVNCNLGMSYAALRDWNNAVKHFEIAVSDRNYPTPYKAYTGMGNALLKQGKSAEAGVAFREAALDEANPDPTKALLNLGVCFMALNRPADAVASYESALQFDMKPDMRNKMYASLGQAYVTPKTRRRCRPWPTCRASTWPPTARPSPSRTPTSSTSRRSPRTTTSPMRTPSRAITRRQRGALLQRHRRGARAVVEGRREAGAQAPQRWLEGSARHHLADPGLAGRRLVPVHAGLRLADAGNRGRAAVRRTPRRTCTRRHRATKTSPTWRSSSRRARRRRSMASNKTMSSSTAYRHGDHARRAARSPTRCRCARHDRLEGFERRVCTSRVKLTR